MPISLRKISSFFFRRPSTILREINSNAMLIQWCRRHHTANVFTDRFRLYEYINSSALNSAPVDYLEFGVYRGTSLFKWADINSNDESRFFGFDSFEGLPEAWDNVRRTHAQGAFDTNGQIPKSEDRRIHFVKGLFQETLRSFLKDFEPSHRLIVHCDCDLYSSALYCLTQLDPILRKGSIIIFDEFFSSSNEFQAFIDYTRSYRRTYRTLAAVGTMPYDQVAVEFE